MNKPVVKFALLVGSAGFAAGWVVCETSNAVKQKRAQLKKQQMIEELKKEAAERLKASVDEPEETGDSEENTPSVVLSPAEEPVETMRNIVEMAQYNEETEDAETKKIPSKPYLIEPDEYEEDDVYEKRELNLYLGDNVLVDDEDEPVTNWKELVGVEALRQIETFGERVVYVRNEKYYRDYMITAVDAEHGGTDDE